MTMKKSEKSLLRLSTAAMLAGLLVLAGCGGSGPDPAPVEPPPSAYEMASDAIMEAETAADAQAAYDAVNQDDISGAEAAKLMAELQDRLDEFATMARITAQKAVLAMAAADVDTSDLSDAAAIGAARTAIMALQAALDAADDVSAADKAMYQSMLDNANTDVTTAQGHLDTQGRMMAQRSAISSAVTAARTAVMAVNNDSSDAEVMAADNAMEVLLAAINGAVDLPMGDADVASAQGTHDTLDGYLDAAKTSRTAALKEAEKARIAEMAAMAVMLYNGISAPVGDGTGNNDRFAAYGTGENAANIAVTIGAGDAPGTAFNLSEDEDAVVAALHGWDGMRFTAEPAGDAGTYEAVVYSDVGEPTMGRKFGSTDAVTETGDYEYQLTDENAVNPGETATLVTGEVETTTDTELAVQARIASSSFDQSAGVKAFDSSGDERLKLPGSYHGVPGYFYCTPAADHMCASEVGAGEGFALGGVNDADPPVFTAGTTGGTWTFKPHDPEQRLMEMPDAIYASYGWWIHKSEDGTTVTASAFAANRGAVAAATDVDDLQGTATYKGGAAGKYALQSALGGINDSGHFTAAATLEADFDADTIEGTIDGFTGADGESRDWSVALGESTVSPTGVIAGDPDTSGNTDPQMTVWTIDGTAADPSGQWSGTLYENEVEGDPTSGVPQIATGTFYSTYGTQGTNAKMVGAFGATEKD